MTTHEGEPGPSRTPLDQARDEIIDELCEYPELMERVSRIVSETLSKLEEKGFKIVPVTPTEDSFNWQRRQEENNRRGQQYRHLPATVIPDVEES